MRVGCMCEPHPRSSSGLGRSNRPPHTQPATSTNPPKNSPDPFLDASEQAQASSKVHIRVQQRNGRKCITTVAGLGEDLDVKRILKVRKEGCLRCLCGCGWGWVCCAVFVCGGAVTAYPGRMMSWNSDKTLAQAYMYIISSNTQRQPTGVQEELFVQRGHHQGRGDRGGYPALGCVAFFVGVLIIVFAEGVVGALLVGSPCICFGDCAAIDRGPRPQLSIPFEAAPPRRCRLMLT